MENFQQKLINAYQAAEKGNFDHARMVLEETLYEFPDAIEAWLLLADLADDADEARQCYQMVLEIDANNWVAQQRMKLLFSGPGGGGMSEIPSRPVLYPDEEFEPTNIFEELDEIAAVDDEDDNEDAQAEGVSKEGPTLKESFAAHKKLVMSVGGGVVAAFVLGAILWVVSLGYIAWRMGYLILGS